MDSHDSICTKCPRRTISDTGVCTRCRWDDEDRPAPEDDVRCHNCAALSAAPLCPGCRANIDYGLSC